MNATSKFGKVWILIQGQHHNAPSWSLHVKYVHTITSFEYNTDQTEHQLIINITKKMWLLNGMDIQFTVWKANKNPNIGKILKNESRL